MSIFTGKGSVRFTIWCIMWLDIIDSIVYILSFSFIYINLGMRARCATSKFTLKALMRERKKKGG